MPALWASFEERDIKNSQGEEVSDLLEDAAAPPYLVRGCFGDFRGDLSGTGP